MKQTFKHIGIFIFMQFFCCALFAQQFVNTSLDGAQTVCAITQDAQGLIWLGTDNGLYSYDGYHSYRHYEDHAFNNTRVNALAFEGQMLYLATGNGVLKFDAQAYRYESTPAMENFQNASKRKAIKELRVLNMLDKHIQFGSDVYALLQTPKGLLEGSLAGLRLNKRQLPLKEGEQPLVNALAYDAKRRCYWIGTEGALYCADLGLKTFSKIAALDGNSIKCLATDKSGNLYIGTDNGLYQMALNNAITHYTHDSRNAATIPNNIVWACFVDKWQNVWVGTDNGLSRLATHTYYQYVSLDKITFSGEGNCLHAILQARNGEWWMGGTNGLIYFTQGIPTAMGATYQDVAWYKQNNSSYPLTHNRVRKIYEDHDGDVWICTDHGINLYDRASRQMRNFIVYDKTGKYSTAWAYDILQDKQGRMWMASYMGGIFIIGKQELLAGKAIADYHLSDHGKNALSGLHVGQMVMDGMGRIWASTFNRLDCINPKTLQVAHVANADVVNFMMTDNQGNVWVGDNTSVKCFYVSGEPNGSHFDSKEWKIGGKVSTMCDVDGKIWVVTGQECCVLDMQGGSMRFKVPSVTPLTMFYSKMTHEVVMGGNDGYVKVRSDVAGAGKTQEKLLLAGIIVNGKSWQNIAGELLLKSDENNFTLQLTDLPFGDHPSAVYAYRLEGSDHDWHYLQSGNIDISYNGVSYGDYHLTVHAVDGEGNIGEEVYSLDVSILPPWYLSIWAKLFYMTALIVFVAWLVSYYFLRKQLMEEQRQKKEVLEQVEARMNFFHRLADSLKAAVAHQSFDEITELINRSIDVNTSIDDQPMIAAPANTVAETVRKAQLPEKETSGEQVSKAGETSAGMEKKPEMDAADMRLLQEINKAIEEHMIDSDFNVTMLQETLGIGAKQLYRKVKALTGHTPVEYIREMRLRKASKLLRAGKFSVSEVMYTVGFSNSSYFSKCFSKAFGMTPTEYMKNS